MKLEEQFLFILLTVFVCLTTLRGMEMPWKPHGDEPVDEPLKNTEINRGFRSFSVFMGQYMNNDTGDSNENPIDRMPILFSDDTMNPNDDSGFEIFSVPADSKYSRNIVMSIPIGDDAVNPSDDSKTEIHASAENSTFSDLIIPIPNPVSNLTDDLVEDSKADSTEEPDMIVIRPQPKTFTVQVREFHECVSCNTDPGARKYYDMCLEELSSKHQDSLKSCCNASFDSEFCDRAASKKIDYKTICTDPKKALKVGDCFWLKVEDKNADDIQKYRECKERILEKYCTIKSSSDADFNSKV